MITVVAHCHEQQLTAKDNNLLFSNWTALTTAIRTTAAIAIVLQILQILLDTDDDGDALYLRLLV